MFDEITEFCTSLPIIDSHSHFLGKKEGMSLDYILKNSYTSWCKVPLLDSDEGRKTYIEKLRYNTYFRWLIKSLETLYALPPLSSDNWEEYNSKIDDAYKNNPSLAFEIYSNMNIESVILDAYWDPGTKHEYGDMFAPTLRINSLLYGWSKIEKDHNGNNPYNTFALQSDKFENYFEDILLLITEKKQAGCVGLKCASAYDRGIDFAEPDEKLARKAFQNKQATPAEIKAFEDMVVDYICKVASKLDIPIQFHTGLGLLNHSSAGNMLSLIERNPKTKFVLMHGGYPNTDEILGICHNFPNIFIDLCWLPLITTSVATRVMEEVAEVALADRIIWGTDTWTAEEAFGAKCAIVHVLSSLCEKKVRYKEWSMKDAMRFCENILYNNAKRLFL